MARRLLSLLLVVCFGYFNAEAVIADVCDGDGPGAVTMPGDVHAAALESAPGHSEDAPRPTHDVAHVCHCTHAHGTLTAALVTGVVDVALHEQVGDAALLQPLGTDRVVHLRPPIALA